VARQELREMQAKPAGSARHQRPRPEERSNTAVFRQIPRPVSVSLSARKGTFRRARKPGGRRRAATAGTVRN